MSYFKSLSGLLLFAFLAGCFGSPVGNNPPVDRSDEEYEQRKLDDEDREETLGIVRTGRTCDKEDRDHDCKEQCGDIYTRRGDREDCEELSVAFIERLEKLHEQLKDADDLEDIDPDEFDIYVNLSIAALDKLVGRYSSREAKDFLVWMISEDAIAKVFEDEDDDHETFEALLKRLESFSGSDIYKPFVEKIDGGDTLMEVAVDSGNEEIIGWFQDFINEKNSACDRDETSLGCWDVYCKIGKVMEDSYRDDLLDVEDFDNYVEDIIEEGTNGDDTGSGNKWNTTEIEDVGDVDDWVDDLCGGLT